MHVWSSGGWVLVYSAKVSPCFSNLLTEVHQYWWTRGKMALPHSLVSSEELTTTTLQKPSQKSKWWLLLCFYTSIRTLPSPRLCLSCLLARKNNTAVFYHRCSWISKLQTSETQRLLQHGPALILGGEGYCCTVARWWFVPENGHMTTQWLRVYGKAQQKVSTKVHFSHSDFTPMLVNEASQWNPQILFSLEGPCYFSKMHSKKESFSPHVTQVILRPHYLLPGLSDTSPPEHH